MTLTNPQKEALFKLYPQIVILRDDEAFDASGNQVSYDINAVNTKAEEIQAAETQAEQAAATHKANAVSKLTALGLSTDEIKALIG
jgi:hypothetical protein